MEFPTLGSHDLPVPLHFGAPVTLHVDVKLIECVKPENWGDDYVRSLSLERSGSYSFEVASGEKLLVMPHDRRRCRDDLVFESGSQQCKLAPGTYRLERWSKGKRKQSADLHVPQDLEHSETINSFAGFSLQHYGAPLPRVLQRVTVDMHHRTGQARGTAVYEYSFEAEDCGDTVPAALRPPEAAPVPGMYEVTPGLRLEALPGGVIRAHLLGHDPVHLPFPDFGDSAAEDRVGPVRIYVYRNGKVEVHGNIHELTGQPTKARSATYHMNAKTRVARAHP